MYESGVAFALVNTTQFWLHSPPSLKVPATPGPPGASRASSGVSIETKGLFGLLTVCCFLFANPRASCIAIAERAGGALGLPAVRAIVGVLLVRHPGAAPSCIPGVAGRIPVAPDL